MNNDPKDKETEMTQTETKEAPRFVMGAEVMVHMCDLHGICRPADVMRLMQESATRQLEALGPNRQTLKKRHQAFILSRISVDLPAPLHLFDKAACTTWPCTSGRGAVFERCFEILAGEPGTEDAPVAARAASQWALLDYENRRLLRTEDLPLSFARDETVETAIPLRFRIPRDAVMEEVGLIERRDDNES